MLRCCASHCDTPTPTSLLRCLPPSTPSLASELFSLFTAPVTVLSVTCLIPMIRIKQEVLSPPPAPSLPRCVTPPPRLDETTAASSADDVASFLVLVEQTSDNASPVAVLPHHLEEKPADSTDEDEGECERIPEEDQLDPDDPEVQFSSMCAERIARIRQHWGQLVQSAKVKQEAEAQVAQQVLAAYDDLYDEADRGADDSDASENGHEAWCEVTDWGGGKADESNDSELSDDEEQWAEAVENGSHLRSEQNMREYSRWRTGRERKEADSRLPGRKCRVDENGGERVDLDDAALSSPASENSGNMCEAQRQRRQSTNLVRASSQPEHAHDRPPQSQQLAQARPLINTDIRDILSEPPTRTGCTWQVFEDGSEGWMYHREIEEEWISQEMTDGNIADATSHSQPTPAVEPASQQAAPAADDCEMQVEDQEETEQEDEEQEQEEAPTHTESRRTRRYRTRSSRSKRRRSADRIEQRKTVRRETSTIRTTRTTTTKTTKHVWMGRQDDSDSHSDSSTAHSRRTRSKRRKAVQQKKRRAARPTNSAMSEEEAETESADEGSVSVTNASVDECEQRANAVESWPDRTNSKVCSECGEVVADSVESSFCSSTCEWWVDHKRFLCDMHRSICATWRQQHDQYYQPMHNLPLYPVMTDELTCCQLPFAQLVSRQLSRSSAIVRAYLDHQLALHPSIRLGPSPIHGTGVFTKSAVPANTRVLTIFGLLYPRDQLLDDRDCRLPAAHGMDRLLDVDALSVEDVTVVMSICRACVAGYINSVKGTRKRRNVRFKCDERVDEQRRSGEGWVPSGLMVVTTMRAIKAGEELLENYPV